MAERITPSVLEWPDSPEAVMIPTDDDDPIGGVDLPTRADLIERRTLLKGLAVGLTGAVADKASADASSDAPQRTTANAPAQPNPAAPAAPRLLDDHQRQTLTNLADSLVPGSVAAGVVDLIDRLAAVDTPLRQRQLLNALGRFDQEARTAHGARWIDLGESVRLDLLRRASRGPESRPPQPVWIKGQPLVFAPSGPPPPATLRDHFDYLRTTIANAYYATEAGMKELGWTGRTAWKELTECTHPDPEHG